MIEINLWHFQGRCLHQHALMRIGHGVVTTPKDSRPAEIPCGSKRGNRFSVCDGIFSLPCFFHGRVVVQLFVVPFETGLSYILLGYSYGKSPFLMILIGRSSISRFIYICLSYNDSTCDTTASEESHCNSPHFRILVNLDGYNKWLYSNHNLPCNWWGTPTERGLTRLNFVRSWWWAPGGQRFGEGTREKERRGGEIPGATETKGVIRGTTASPQPGENWGCGM